MPCDQGAVASQRKGRPRKDDELHIALHFASQINNRATIGNISDDGIIFPTLELGRDGKVIIREGRKVDGETLSRRYRNVSGNIRESEQAVALHVAANARTTWGAPLQFPSGFLPENRPKAGCPPKKRRR